MQFDVETPLKGYNGAVGAVTFVDGRARVTSDQRAELAYFRRHDYKITPVAESAGKPADAAAQRQGEPYEPTGDGTGEGFDASALTAAAAKAAETAKPSGTDEDGPGEPLRKPAKNAPVAAWTTYAKQLGATDEELGGKTKNELVELVDQYEQREVGP
ncbi:hypothetical protein [Actinomadura sp. WMMA1423]|uniref:hypothetical protein n=1 Tax=Actinomadura sp. WMMA1423 TaxID=2591108 RepID=UPI00114690C7|nr:hypothetical protein [Actinomadura sp. WMMA1423]